jgi:hypothetical protein
MMFWVEDANNVIILANVWTVTVKGTGKKKIVLQNHEDVIRVDDLQGSVLQVELTGTVMTKMKCTELCARLNLSVHWLGDKLNVAD